ncbi:hypothetical protein [Erythrobacter sp. BLCC-B19]|uniref:hypothetical protein n=1 Tax=Erythrobacter sp. BLCC-B19 TaxID=3025315 RepID=UPI00236233C5|nr:hypothetical protein [Erythrobacter sp. BLCC-B19]WDA41020.1 hypothetical protein PS060_15925 [Erythrobacter sp. BLCC-B19]
MGSDSTRSEGAFVGQLADHARQLQREAREAIARGDYARASALIGDAELLAGDVHGLVDDFEHREADRMVGHAAAEAEAQRPRLRLRPNRLRFAIGASLAISLALVEC